MAYEGLILREDRKPVPLTPEERLTRQFYAWEQRGRGWQVWPYPVSLEPPFRPFFFHYCPPAQPAVDDGRKPTFLSSLVDRLKGRNQPSLMLEQWSDASEDEEIIEAEASAWCGDERIVEIHVALPPKVIVSKEIAEQFLLSLSYCTRPVSFEVVGLPTAITVQIACSESDTGQVWQQLQAYFPDAVLTEETGFLQSQWDGGGGKDTVVVDFGLSNEFMLPLRSVKNFDVDPLIGITGALFDLQPGELGMLQVLLQTARAPWAESIARSVMDSDGSAFFADAPDLVPLSRHKVARPLFACSIRVAVQSHSYQRTWQIVKALGSALTQFGSPASNELLALSNNDYNDIDHEVDVLSRQTHRSGMILNIEELVSLVHLPSSSVRTEKLKRQGKKTKPAPAIATGQSLVLGENRHGGVSRQVSLNAEQRTRHMYVIGASGTGKSTLLVNLIRQDIEQGQGVAVLDPHGDLIDHILGLVPEDRFDDVVLFDPSDEAYPIGFNILSAHSELEKNLLESDLVGVFRRLSTTWGDQMNSVLSNAILAFLESSRGGTLADLRRFLVEPEFRHDFLGTVQDQTVVYYWLREFPLLTGRPQAPLLTRLDSFLRPKPIRYMVAQKENRIDFAKVMNGGKIFLAKLSQGAIGEENSYLLGSLLVSKFHQMALSRQELSHAERRHYWLYIDEFQNFVTPSMASILSGARKYRLGLILAHQELRQLLSKDTEVASAVITNPYTRICFRMGDDDARKLSDGFAFFDATDLQNLGVGEAICRIERADYDFNLHTLQMPGVDEEEAEEKRAEIQARSRQKYGRLRSEVEAEIASAHPQVSIPVPHKAPVRERVSRKEAQEPTPPIPEPMVSDLPVHAVTIAEPEEVKKPRKERSKGATVEAVQPGRGGQQHKYLQQLIKRWGEERGFKATIEKQVAGGSVDVALEKDGQAIACEISVTTTVEHEVGNIQKCLAAGFEQIAVVSSEKKALGKIQDAAITALSEMEINRVQFYLPEDFFMYIDQIGAESKGKEEVIKGYKVKVKYKSLTAEEQKARKQAIAQTVLQAMRRLRERG